LIIILSKISKYICIMPGSDKGFPDIIEGRSLIKKNTEVATDLDTIRLNKNTVLHSICSPPEGVPLKKDSNKTYQKNNDSSYISGLYYQILNSYGSSGKSTEKR